LSIAKPRIRRLLGGFHRRPMPHSADLNIEYVANLARIELTAAEKTRFALQLGEILHYVEKLRQVDVTGVEPMAHAAPVYNVWAEDVARPGLSAAAALGNAPAQRDEQVILPKIVE
jgi:aspartyl-tRNA(Asn)/glutamyl-tRNA(Gln) amidotransferase subunit C